MTQLTPESPGLSLQQVTGRARYKPGWSFTLRSGFTMSTGSCTWQEAPFPTSGTTAHTILLPPLFLVICARVRDSGSGNEISLEHLFPVPDEPAVPWQRWLLDRILDVERHEACEFFALGEERPFYPEHGPDARLYDIIEREPVRDPAGS